MCVCPGAVGLPCSAPADHSRPPADSGPRDENPVEWCGLRVFSRHKSHVVFPHPELILRVTDISGVSSKPLSSDAQRPAEAQTPRAQAHRCPSDASHKWHPGYPPLCLADCKPGAPTTLSSGLRTHRGYRPREVLCGQTCAGLLGGTQLSRSHRKGEQRSRQGPGHWVSLPSLGPPPAGTACLTHPEPPNPAPGLLSRRHQGGRMDGTQLPARLLPGGRGG